ncbi:hypothetical protein SAMN05421766_101192 [Zobellia uliginosa]|uniref:Uncharacterized protein n=1 Tax=Zobellia uliginosa TaxID=143224 RepID=A0ABY1KI34_9FLAO|nr:hypothetical protein SAMN05421766_101192 [Zobellia uliginosa]
MGHFKRLSALILSENATTSRAKSKFKFTIKFFLSFLILKLSNFQRVQLSLSNRSLFNTLFIVAPLKNTLYENARYMNLIGV